MHMRLEAPPLRRRRLEFLGDSITIGFGVLCHKLGISGCILQAESFADSWAHLVCEALEAECMVGAWSGWGLVMNGYGGEIILPDIWARTLATVPAENPLDIHGTARDNRWDLMSWRPDAVVINIGTNDKLNERPHLSAQFRQKYLKLVLDLAGSYGSSTRFFLACGPMDEAYCDVAKWVITQVTADPHRIEAVFLDQRGFNNGSFGKPCCGHPEAQAHVAMAAGALPLIRATMDWWAPAVYDNDIASRPVDSFPLILVGLTLVIIFFMRRRSQRRHKP